ncbi:MAG: hypothetical protein K0M70_13605 [Arenimonas sp.]|uniref:hypothetical protein n=1 Tax=Arenimonas sp. TaxID=1872635 RepID=UPI0025C21273|nr:hypothetical protein [Arenimonas sp.]MBW8368881.1 hypothetical protein [Arenimonas sp.]
MPIFPVVLTVVGGLLSITGILMVVGSLLSAHGRGQKIAFRFWAPPEMLVGRELSQNRLGFSLSVAGTLVVCVPIYLLWPN